MDSEGLLSKAPEAGSFVNRNFLLLVQGSWVNQVGTQIALVATTVWLRRSTDSAGMIGLLVTASALPMLLLGPLGGVFADRWFRRNSLILWDVICSAASFSLMFVVGNGALPLSYGVAAIFAGTILLSSANAFTSPAFSALIPDVVPPVHLAKAMAFTQASSLVAIIVGQAMGGLLVGHYAPHVLFGLDAATYVLSAVAGYFVLVPALPDRTPRSVNGLEALYKEIREGIQYVGQRKGMRTLLLAAIPMNVFTMPIFVFLPFYTTNVLRAPLSTYGYLLATFSFGLLVGYALAGKLSIPADRIGPVVFGCVLGNALICLSLGAIHWYAFAAMLLCVLGCFSGMVTLLSINALISQTDPDKRGRVSAMLVMIVQGLTPLIMSFVGVIGDLLHGNVQPIYSFCGAALFVLAATLFFNRPLRRFLKGLPE